MHSKSNTTGNYGKPEYNPAGVDENSFVVLNADFKNEIFNNNIVPKMTEVNDKSVVELE